MHAYIAGFGEQELRTVASPLRVGCDVFTAHKMTEPVAYERHIQFDGEKLDDTYGEGHPIHGDERPNHVTPVQSLDAYRDFQR